MAVYLWGFIEWIYSIVPPFSFGNSYSPVLRINIINLTWIERIKHCDGNIQALLRTELISMVVMIFFDCLYNVDSFFALKYADFVACVEEQDYEKQDTAQCSSFRG